MSARKMVNAEQQARIILPSTSTAILQSHRAHLYPVRKRMARLLVIAAPDSTFATILLAPIAITRHRAELRTLTRRELSLGLVSGLFLAVHFATWISSLEYTSVASSVVFVSTGPLWVALLSPMLLNERLRRPAMIGLGLAILGGTVIGLSDACTWSGGLQCPDLDQVMQDGPWGNYLALAGAWTVTGYLIIGRAARADVTHPHLKRRRWL
jgi:drug/metabolite transporter (DMT)-like permease